MFIWPRGGGVRPLVAGCPSPLLTHIAGAFAPAIAACWPAPHEAFLTAPAERRHLVCIALATSDDPLALPGEALLRRPLHLAIRLAVRGAPDGLSRALRRLGETAWEAEDYRSLLVQLAHPRIAKVWRHADAIEPVKVRAFARQPARLLDRQGGPLVTSIAAAEVVSECLAIIRTRAPCAAEASVERWLQASNLAALLDQVRCDLLPPFVDPALELGPRFRRLTTQADLDDAAKRYQNCVATYGEDAALGRAALYEWLGDPGAIVELAPDPNAGWRLNQARLAYNADVTEPLRGEIAGALRTAGVRVGRSYWQLSHALSRAGDPDYVLPPADEDVFCH